MNYEEGSGSYFREMGRDVIADIHVHGVFGVAAITVHHVFSEHLDNEDIAVLIMSAFISGSVVMWLVRRCIRRRREKKMKFRYDWIQHL